MFRENPQPILNRSKCIKTELEACPLFDNSLAAHLANVLKFGNFEIASRCSVKLKHKKAFVGYSFGVMVTFKFSVAERLLMCEANAHFSSGSSTELRAAFELVFCPWALTNCLCSFSRSFMNACESKVQLAQQSKLVFQDTVGKGWASPTCGLLRELPGRDHGLAYLTQILQD
jgi:hypothetical protein